MQTQVHCINKENYVLRVKNTPKGRQIALFWYIIVANFKLVLLITLKCI